MLHAVKKELRADLARDILKVRQREVNYYTTNILNIGMQAALLAGFAFTTLAQHDSSNVLSWLEEVSGSRTFVVIASFILDPQQQMQVILEVLYLTSTISGTLCAVLLFFLIATRVVACPPRGTVLIRHVCACKLLRPLLTHLQPWAVRSIPCTSA